MADEKITELVELTSVAASDMAVIVDDPAGTPVTKKVSVSNLLNLANASGDLPVANLDAGANASANTFYRGDGVWAFSPSVQKVSNQTGAANTGTTTIPLDDTIPQNTEGTEFLTVSITPKSASNKLKIDVVFYGSTATNDRWNTVAIFQDLVADALATGISYQAAATAIGVVKITYHMTAGTTSSTTFKLRAGPNAAGTITMNGASGTRRFGGTFITSMTVEEYIP